MRWLLLLLSFRKKILFQFNFFNIFWRVYTKTSNKINICTIKLYTYTFFIIEKFCKRFMLNDIHREWWHCVILIMIKKLQFKWIVIKLILKWDQRGVGKWIYWIAKIESLRNWLFNTFIIHSEKRNLIF